MDAGQLDEAAVEFQAAIRLQPDLLEAHNNLGVALVRQGRLDDAIRQFSESLRINPQDADAAENLREAQQERQKAGPEASAR